MKRKAVILGIIMCVLLLSLPVMTKAGNIGSGTFGSLSWVIDEDGVLTITGSGNMPPKQSSDMSESRNILQQEPLTIIGQKKSKKSLKTA